MKILGFIPARGGSKGVPGKNKKLLGGLPLIAYSIKAAQQSKLLTDIFVSTDDAEIATIAGDNGVDVPSLRPAELAADSTPTLPVIVYTLDLLRSQGKSYDAVCILQPTSPFRQAGLIDACINDWQQSGADTIFTTTTVPHELNPHWVFEKKADGNLKIATGEEQIIPRRQLLPPAFIRDGSIYIIKTSVIENGSLYGAIIRGYDNDKSMAVNIDTMADWAEAEEKLASFLAADTF